jgi:hypothetical protein
LQALLAMLAVRLARHSLVLVVLVLVLLLLQAWAGPARRLPGERVLQHGLNGGCWDDGIESCRWCQRRRGCLPNNGLPH